MADSPIRTSLNDGGGKDPLRPGSVAFAVLGVLWTAILGLLFLPLALAPRRCTQQGARFWAAGLLYVARLTVGISHRVIGRERLPRGPALIAVNHQSAWETLIFHQLLDDPVFIVKQELFRVPVFGWYLKRSGAIAIDRQAGARALKDLVAATDRALAAGAQVIIFPEGTRTPPGSHRPFQPGVAAVYLRAGVAVVPCAVNSGLYWAARGLPRKRGTITLEVMPPIPAGLPRDAFMTALQSAVGGAADRLAAIDAPGRAAAAACELPE